MSFWCAAALKDSYFLSLGQKKRNTVWSVRDDDADNGKVCLVALKWYYPITSVNIGLFQPYYSDWTLYAKLVTTYSAWSQQQKSPEKYSQLSNTSQNFSTVMISYNTCIWHIHF